MAGKRPPIIEVRGILGGGPHDATGDLGLLVGLSDGSQAIIQIEQSILSGLELILRGYLAKTSYTDEGGMVAARPMELQSCQPFTVGDGRVGMVLEIEHMRLPVAFPVAGVPILIQGLRRMLKLAKKQPKPKFN